MSFLDPADNLRRLVLRYDELACLDISYPCTAELDGIPGQVPSYRRLTHALPHGGCQVLWSGSCFRGPPPRQELHLHGS